MIKRRLRNNWVNVSVLLSPESYEELTRLARFYGSTRSELTRFWVEKHIKLEQKRETREREAR